MHRAECEGELKKEKGGEEFYIKISSYYSSDKEF